MPRGRYRQDIVPPFFKVPFTLGLNGGEKYLPCNSHGLHRYATGVEPKSV